MAGIEEVSVQDEESALDSDPFGGQGRGIEVEVKEYNVSQLAEEISARTGKDVSVVILRSKTRRKLWITPREIDMRKVRGAVKSHEVDPEWGLTDEDVENQRRIRRLKSGEKLSLEESNAVLRALIRDREETGTFVE